MALKELSLFYCLYEGEEYNLPSGLNAGVTRHA
jgi:hypothetical protein